jgi:hypothetical protein
METTLKEVLISFNTKELEHFNEATKNCTSEQKLAVAKRMREEELPEGWQLTASAIKRLVTQDSLSKVNWYPGIKINDGTASTEQADNQRLKDIKERQYKAYRAGGMSEADARGMAGL